jgi:hypothetical protein
MEKVTQMLDIETIWEGLDFEGIVGSIIKCKKPNTLLY